MTEKKISWRIPYKWRIRTHRKTKKTRVSKYIEKHHRYVIPTKREKREDDDDEDDDDNRTQERR